MTLAQLGSFEIKAQTLFPTIYQQSGFNRQVPRFAIRVVRDGQTVYQRRYSASETSLLQALTAAISWVRFRRRQERLEYIGSLPALSLWTFCMAIGWLFQPIVGWLSFLPASCEYPVRLVFRATKVEIASHDGFTWWIPLGEK